MSERKDKMISLRLSDEEYEVVTSASRSNGARNLSEFARAAMLQLSTGPIRTINPVICSIEHLTRRVDEVYHEVRKVAVLLGDSESQPDRGGDRIEVAAGDTHHLRPDGQAINLAIDFGAGDSPPIEQTIADNPEDSSVS